MQSEIKQTSNSIKQMKLDKISSGFTSVGNSLKTFGSNLQSIGYQMMIVSGLFTGLGAKAINLSSDYQESMNKIDVAFDKNAKEVKDWAKTTTDAFGISELKAMDMAALFGDMGKGMGLSAEQTKEYAMSLTELAGDLSSYKNVSQEVAQNALKGVFTGETESLKGLGIVMNDSILQQYALSKGIKKKYSEMTQAEKVSLRYQYVMETASDAVGDFAKNQNTFANQTRRITARLQNLGKTMGDKLLPYAEKVADKIIKLLDAFEGLDDKTQFAILALGGLMVVVPPLLVGFGLLVSATGAIVGALGGLITACSPVLLAVAGLGGAFVGLATSISTLATEAQKNKIFIIL